MGRRWGWKGIGALALLVGSLFLLGGCGSLEPEKSQKASADWSRGLRLGVASLNQAVALQVSGGGEVHLAWSEAGDRGMEIAYLRLGQNAQERARVRFSPGLFFPREPVLVLDAADAVHLFCLGSEGRGRPDGVYHGMLDTEGHLQGKMARVTPENHPVTSYRARRVPDGTIALLWADASDEAPGIYYVALTPEGALAGEPVRVAPGGTEPDMAVAEDGHLHLAWVEEPEPGQRVVRYGILSPGTGELLPPGGMAVGSTPVETGLVTYPPRVGLDDTHAYVFWSVEHRGGLAQGLAESFFAAVPLREHAEQPTVHQVLLPEQAGPSSGEVTRLEFLPLAHPSTRKFDSRNRWYPLQPMTFRSPEFVGPYSGYVLMAAPLPYQGPSLPVAFAVKEQFRRRAEVEPVLALFEGGALWGHQEAGRTGSLSLFPTLEADAAGNLHLTWVDFKQFGEYHVFYATTAPGTRQALDRVTVRDAALAVVNFGWGMLSGLSLIPLTVILLVPSLLWVGLTYIFGSGDDLAERGVQISLAIAAALYLGMKFFVFSSLLANPPFLGLVPAWAAPALTWGLPLAILAAAAGATALYARKGARPNLFWGFAWFAGVDILLTLTLYGPAFFGD
ncbi:MAG: hypothetical protein ACP5UM_04215 [Anaerolineae bacterium]